MPPIVAQEILDSAPKQYLEWYYSTEIWQKVTYRGVHCLKSVSDMWNYQEIITELNPFLVVEFGTCFGGSALFFADIARCRVLTIDIDHSHVHESVRSHPLIELLQTDTTSPATRARISELRAAAPVGRKAFFIVDSNHSKTHVLNEMMQLRTLTVPGDYVVVEDGIINGHPVLPDWGEGPFEALAEYYERYPGDYAHDIDREMRFGFTCALNGFLIRQ
jgi:cephalosporin hydroxylase